MTLWYRITAMLLSFAAAVTLSACGTKSSDAVSCGRDETLAAAGSPVQIRAMAVFRSAWVSQCPDRVFSYLAMDPADAVSRFTEGRVDIAGVHSQFDPAELHGAAGRCDGGPVLHLPIVLRGISLPYNLPGVGELVLSGRLIAEIFSGEITNWADPRITASNPGTRIPDLPVTPVLANDDAILTEDFTAYLRAVGHNGRFAEAQVVRARTSTVAVRTVTLTPGAIAYTADRPETIGLPSALVDSGRGPVALTDESAMLAIDAAEFEETGDDLRLATDTLYRTREPGGYPLIGVSYDLVCAKGYGARAPSVRSFLTTAATIDHAVIAAAGYIPLPKFLRERIMDVVDSLE